MLSLLSTKAKLRHVSQHFLLALIVMDDRKLLVHWRVSMEEFWGKCGCYVRLEAL